VSKVFTLACATQEAAPDTSGSQVAPHSSYGDDIGGFER
jgi:hypothetical protein